MKKVNEVLNAYQVVHMMKNEITEYTLSEEKNHVN